MSIRRVVGIVLIVVGIVVLVWGGVFWTDEETVLEAGPIEVQMEDQEGISLQPALGIVAIVGGIILVAIQDRRRT